MRKTIVFYLLVAFLLTTVLLILRKSDLIVHIIAETNNPTSSIRLQMDGRTVFDGRVNSGVYFGEKILIEDVYIGFHSLKIEALEDNVVYQRDGFYLFNRTTIIMYFDKSTSEKRTRFNVWNKFGKFLPD